MAGICRSPLGADGCGDVAKGISISQIDVYQAVRVPIMTSGAAVAASRRNADVIAGHQAVFRVAVQPDSNFAARELSARLSVYNDVGEDTYFAKQRVSSASSLSDPSSTFQIKVPADRLTTKTRYALELVECGAGQGSARSARFPSSGEVNLEARETGKMKIVIVPVRANNRLPDLSKAVLDRYQAYLMAMFPITEIELSVTSEITTRYPVDWAWMLDQIRAKRRQEAPARDVYYYGLVAPVATFKAFCGNGCTVGIGSVIENVNDAANRTAVGVSFGDESSAATLAHELGHNHGRWHAPCGNVAQADSRFPYRGGGTSVWGYDERNQQFQNPASTKDIMGYCDPKWISDYTFQALANRVAVVNGPGFSVADNRPFSRWRTILIDGSGVRWGHRFEQPDQPFGNPESAEILDRDGVVIEQVAAFRSGVADAHEGAATVLIPEPEPGWHAVRIRGIHVPVSLAFEAP